MRLGLSSFGFREGHHERLWNSSLSVREPSGAACALFKAFCFSHLQTKMTCYLPLALKVSSLRPTLRPIWFFCRDRVVVVSARFDEIACVTRSALVTIDLSW